MNHAEPGRRAGPVKQTGLLGSSAVMAAGTIVSRLTGVLRAIVIAATIGLVGVTADTFNIPNVIPNMLYIFIGGGVLNSVLVPAMVRAIKQDADDGEAYSQRLFSLMVVVLGVATVAAVIAAPGLIRLFVSEDYQSPELAPFFDNMVMFARFCLPQIFFYGLYVLIGQMLNARGRFGPMMWAPILNNVVAIAIFGGYLLVAGQKVTGGAPEPFTDAEVLLLGLGSTVAVAVQAIALVPVLRRTGFRIRFRTDWRHSGLGTAIRLGLWTVAFVLVNQIAYVFIVKTASGGAAGALAAADPSGAGYTVYTNAMLIMMVPHAVVTVSLATALLPKLADHATDGNLALVRDRLVSAIRICLAVIVPMAGLLAVLAIPLAALIFDYGAAAGDTDVLAITLVAMLPGLVAFTVHYLVLRGFYALEDTRTPFVVQLWIAGTLIVNALIVGRAGSGDSTTLLLALGYSLAYVIGASVSLTSLGRRVGGIAAWSLLGHIGRLAVPAAAAAAAAYGLSRALDPLADALPGWLANLTVLAVAGTVGLLLFALLAYLLRITEVRDGTALVARRVRSRRGPTGPSM